MQYYSVCTEHRTTEYGSDEKESKIEKGTCTKKKVVNRKKKASEPINCMGRVLAPTVKGE